MNISVNNQLIYISVIIKGIIYIIFLRMQRFWIPINDHLIINSLNLHFWFNSSLNSSITDNKKLVSYDFNEYTYNLLEIACIFIHHILLNCIKIL